MGSCGAAIQEEKERYAALTFATDRVAFPFRTPNETEELYSE